MISGKDLEGWITAPDPLAAMEKAQNQALYRKRRERIATACLAASIVKFGLPTDQMFKDAVECADAFIAELDKEVQP